MNPEREEERSNNEEVIDTSSVVDSAVKTRNDVRATDKSDSSFIEQNIVFKKPLLLIGPRRGKTCGKIRTFETPEQRSVAEPVDDIKPNLDILQDSNDDITPQQPVDQAPEIEIAQDSKDTQDYKSLSKFSPAQKLNDCSIPLPYKEPSWSAIPTVSYNFEVLKSGSILETINLSSKPFYVFGRLSTCDIHMAHPTVSRFHAVLQYSEGTEEKPMGFYIYDFGSTHGTFLNKYRIKSNMYVRVQVGHMLKLGGSSRMFILQGPDQDMEQESELTVTELKERRQQELQARDLEAMKLEEEVRLKQEQAEKNGIDWGMGEDADEESDLTVNPFAATQNEELYINDPKKSLRGWFEREGYELDYDVEEKGFGQFLCRVELPVDNTRGGTMVAEALVKGKKKEAVVQCALEACRILDRYGLLRQATHESKKRKAKNWEDEDFYDSDEDTFLDRTGSVEKKRHQRMQAAGKIQTQTETYESLLKKHGEVTAELNEMQKQLDEASKTSNAMGPALGEEEDALDAFMTSLSSGAPDKKLIRKLKSQLAVLHMEEARLRRLVNIARPASLPELVAREETANSTAKAKAGPKGVPLIGVRRKPRVPKTRAHHNDLPVEPGGSKNNEKEEEEVEENEEEEEEDDEENVQMKVDNSHNENGIPIPIVTHSSEDVEQGKQSPECFKGKGTIASVHEASKINEQVKESLVEDSKPNEDLNKSSKLIGPSLPRPEELGPESEESIEKRRKRNKRRTQHRIEKASREKQSKVDYDALDPDYSVWVPPDNQSGDGRTKLNDKYGY